MQDHCANANAVQTTVFVMILKELASAHGNIQLLWNQVKTTFSELESDKNMPTYVRQYCTLCVFAKQDF